MTLTTSDLAALLAGAHLLVLVVTFLLPGIILSSIFLWRFSQYSSRKKWKVQRKRKGQIAILLITMSLSTAATYFLSFRLPTLVSVQQDKSVLIIKNYGPGDIRTFNLYATEYKASGQIREGGHFYFDGDIETVSKLPMKASNLVLDARASQTIHLAEALPFRDDLPIDFDSARTFYVIRLVFKPVSTSLEEACYVIVPFVQDFPSFFNERGTGPYKFLEKVQFGIQDKMLTSQRNMFRDQQSDWCRESMILGRNRAAP